MEKGANEMQENLPVKAVNLDLLSFKPSQEDIVRLRSGSGIILGHTECASVTLFCPLFSRTICSIAFVAYTLSA
jgi:hypothetical protein